MNKKILSLIDNNISEYKYKRYSAIIGSNPSKNARSPKLWNKVYKKKKLPIRMVPLDVKKKNLKKLFNLLNLDKNFIGGAVTTPYKELIFNLLNKNIKSESKKIGAVNCLYRKKNNLFGTNTDGEAALFSILKAEKSRINNKNILLIGPGGAGKAIISFLINSLNDKKKLTVIYRSQKSKNFLKKIGCVIENYKNFQNICITNFQIIINCSTIGFEDQKSLSPIDIKILQKVKKKTLIFDIIYNPKKTKLLQDAQDLQIRNLNGSNMNLEQAVLAFHYTNRKIIKFLNYKSIKKIMSSATR